MTNEQAIKRWKELNIESCNMEFSCGGDSMNDWNFTFTDKENNDIEDRELKDFFDDEVFKRVEFYVNSDGHYIGESGTVVITFEDDDEPFFNYCKGSTSEWNESIADVISIELTPEQIAYIEKNVNNINGSENEVVINYKRDFILTDSDIELEESIKDNIKDYTNGYQPEIEDGELSDWFTFTTDIDNNANPIIKDNQLQVSIDKSFTQYRED